MNEHRIHGPPGCGKTTTLAQWVAAAAKRVGGERVVVTSFTRAAALEIGSRGIPIPRDNVGTLHALCYRAMQRPTIAETKLKEWNGFRADMALAGGYRASVDDVDGGGGGEAPTAGSDAMYMRMNILRSRMAPRALWPEPVQAFAKAWDEWKIVNGYLDFTDLLEQALVELPHAPSGAAVIFVDEAQDMDPLQLKLVRQWAKEIEFVVLVGDADQCLYRFKGCSPRDFLEPEIPASHNKVLGQSYRVPRAVHALATRWIARASYRYPSEYLPRAADGRVRRLDAPIGAGDDVALDVAETLKSGRSVMLLASCGFQLQHVIAALRAAGIPYHNPYRESNGAWNPMRGGVQRLRALMKPLPEGVGGDSAEWTTQDLRLWLEPLDAKLCLNAGAKKRLGEMADEPLRVSNPDDLRGLIQPEDLDALRAALRALSPEQLVRWYEARVLSSREPLVDFAMTVLRARGPAGLTEIPKVVVGTIHSVKGGEADVVYLCPDLSPSSAAEWCTAGDPRDSIIRAFYVGATRAREELVILRRGGGFSVDMEDATS